MFILYLKTKKFISIIVSLSLVCIIFNNVQLISANEFEGNEEYWTNYCSGYITDSAKKSKCNEYANYIQTKINNSKGQANSLANSIAKVEDDLSNLREVSQAYSDAIISAENEINTLTESLVIAEESLEKVKVIIIEKEAIVEKRKEIIRDRMLGLQVEVNVNQFIEYLMGATDLVDLIQRSQSIESFTRSDKELIELLNKEVDELDAEKDEQQRIQETLLLQQDQLKIKQAELKTLIADNEKLIEENEKKVIAMLNAQNEANAAANTLAQLRPNFSISSDGSADVAPSEPSNGWISPIRGTGISRGVNNSGHRGVDIAADDWAPIVAPANCYVVFASNSYPNKGWLGNGAGIPQGGGNSLRIIFNVNGEVFAMNFHHMMNNVTAMAYNGSGQVVPQGTVLGYVGSSGNSSGTHAHVELFKYKGLSLQQAIARWYATGDWQTSCGWTDPTPYYGSYADRVNPLNYISY